MELELAVVELWDRMGELFGAKWLKQFGDTDSPAFDTWCRLLGDLTEQHIERGFANMLRSFQETGSRFMPDALEFREHCLNLKALGLPEPRAAYQEACRAPSPKIRFNWTHPAVYQAGMQTGWFELASMPTDDIYPRFAYNYDLICKRVIAGEDIAIPVPEAIPEKINAPMTQQQKISQMESLRDGLGI